MTVLSAPAGWSDGVDVWVIGAGGNGGEVIDALAQFHTALRALGHAGLNVAIIDDARVREVNLVRQRFWQGDIGQYKAIALANRYNLLLGTQWQGLPMRIEDAVAYVKRPDLIISAVDVASARRFIGKELTLPRRTIWLDLGNNARNGQAILGMLGDSRYPSVLDHYPEIEDMADDTTKSCSTAEAIAAQDCLVNRTVATAGMNLVWDLLRRGETGKNGIIVDLASGQQIPLLFPKQEDATEAA